MRRYLFADESGNFDFRDHQQYKGASRYFAVGTLCMDDPQQVEALNADLFRLRENLAERGTHQIDSFHASEDPNEVRNEVFKVLSSYDFRVDVTILEKAKAQPRLYRTDDRFYQYAWFYHLRFLATWKRLFPPASELRVVTAAIGQNRKMKKAMNTAVESVVDQCTPVDLDCQVRVRQTQSDFCLQAVDYALWAVMRKFERSDPYWVDTYLAGQVASAYDLFAPGRVFHYGPKQNIGLAA
ncbi:DUF3800 domain-containing protein [Georgenia sp. 311]|uniref:DUF3800 domain-containing protein n=1 Tax=Georgenia sp. 311 TaxID=2585134 RepID=UPI00159BE32A|nr:DUF3800 domain-containing protein [Georgenia sp. 311]